MKASSLGLLVATAAMGGSAIYLWTELRVERERSAGLEAQGVELSARIAELEQTHARFGQRSLTGANTFGGRAMAGPAEPPPPAGAGAVANETGGPRMSAWSVRNQPQQSEAMRKMMRAQSRAYNKRMYGDVGSALGLSKDQANKLLDLITDQQMGSFAPFQEGQEAIDSQNAWAEKQRRLQGEISELLGDEKVAALENYQKSLPARAELEMLARQLEGYDAPLDDDQRKRMLKVMAEERDRVPAPDFVDGVDLEEFQKTRGAWEEDYNNRVASQARGILDTEQLDAYNEYQQAQKDMRAQFGQMMPAGPSRTIGGVAGENVTFTNAAPVSGAIISVDAVYVNAAPEPDKKK
jgi:hypothetical protein